MKYEENAFVELKREVNEDLKNEIIAFLNSYSGGVIYVGVDDDGEAHHSTQKERDFNESIIINWSTRT